MVLEQIENKLVIEKKYIDKKYIDCTYQFLYALDNIVLLCIESFKETIPIIFLDYHITYDAKNDIVYIWLDKKNELFAKFLSLQLTLVNNYLGDIERIKEEEKIFITKDYINDFLILELNYNGKKVIKKNTYFNLKYIEI